MASELNQDGVLKAGTILRNRYEITGLLSIGGQKRVYTAMDLKTRSPRRQIILKEMHRGSSYSRDVVQAQLFHQEVKILLELKHPSLPRIYDLFLDKGTYYLVEEYIRGDTLREYMKKRKQFPVEEALESAIRLAEALDYLHQNKVPIIYRDLNPSNVIMRDGQPMLIDLSSAYISGMGSEAERVSLSTRGYTPPEGTRGAHPTVDIYALGIILYEILVGADVRRIEHGAFPKISESRSDVSFELEKVVIRAVEQTRAKRYQTMFEMKSDMEKVLRRIKFENKINEMSRNYHFLAPFLSVPRKGYGYFSAMADVLVLMLIGSAMALPFVVGPILPLKSAFASLKTQMFYLFCLYAIVVHMIWRHWFAKVKHVHAISRLLHRPQPYLGGMRPIRAMVIFNILVLLIFIIGSLLAM